MAGPALTHAQLAAKLAVDGVLPIVEGKTRQDQIPIPAHPLNAETKARLDLPADSLAVFYPLSETGVFMMLNGASARVWYAGENTDGALEVFERKLREGYPSALFSLQNDHPEVKDMSVRLYHIDFTPQLMAEVEVTYPTALNIPQQFIIRVHARQRIGRPS